MRGMHWLTGICLALSVAGCGGGSSMPGPGAPAQNGASQPPAQQSITPAPGYNGSAEALDPPLPTSGLPLPPSPAVTGAASATPASSAVDLSWLDLTALPGTLPPQPADWEQRKQQAQSRRGSAAKSAADTDLNMLNPFDPVTLTALGQFAPPNGGSCYAFLSSDNPATPALLETFNAQHLPGGVNELHIWGAVTNSALLDMVLAEIGLVTDETYTYAIDPNGDGNPGDGVPSWMFNQNAALLNGINGGLAFTAPLDFNAAVGRGFARTYFGPGFDFDLRLVPNQAVGGTGGLCWLRIRPRSFPLQPWTSYAGTVANPAAGFPYGIDNWGWRGPEDFTSALLLAQIYSYNQSGNPGSITFQWVRATNGPLYPPAVDCRALPNARFLLASPGANGLQEPQSPPGDDTALTGYASTNAVMNAEPVLRLGDQFYVYFDRDPAQANDLVLYPNVPVLGLVQYTTTGLIAPPALAACFELPDAVPGYPGRVYSAAHPFTLVLRPGAYNRIQNDLRSLSWAGYQLATSPGFTALTPVRSTAGSHLDRVILAQGVAYLPFYYSLPYTQAGSYAPLGSAEIIYPNAHTTGWITVGYGSLSEGGTVLGDYYNQAALTNTLQADAYCRFETRANWGSSPQYGLADLDLLQWIALPMLDPRAQPWNTFALARGTDFYLQTTDISASPFVSVTAGQLLDAGLGPVTDVPFNAVGGGGPYNGSFNVLPVRIFDDPAQSDPLDNVAQVADGWEVTVNFLLQYGAGPYTVELDTDYDGAWDSPLAGRVYQIDGDPAAAGMQQFSDSGLTYSRLAHIPAAHTAGSYTFAIRVTDANGDEYIYAWPAPVVLPGEPVLRDEWFMFGHDPQHTRRSPYTGAQTSNVKWSFATEGIIESSPAVAADGTVYIGNYGTDNRLFAINPDGTQRWSFVLGDSVYSSSPAIAPDGTVYVGCLDNLLYALNPDGTLKWTYATGGPVRSSPAIGADGTVYVGSWDDKIYAIRPDGSLRWSYTTGDWVESAPAIGLDGTIYAGSYDGNLYALNPDGSLQWAYDVHDVIQASPAIAPDGTVYIGSWNRNLYAINPNGTLRWMYNTFMYIDSSPAIGADGTVYVGNDADRLYAFNPNGTLKWYFVTSDFVESSPAVGGDGTIYVGSYDNTFYAINPDGSLKWSYATGARIHSSPAIGNDGTVYVGSNDGKLYAFGGDSGGNEDWFMFGHDPQHTRRSPYVAAQTAAVEWIFRTGGELYSSPALASDGTVYIGSGTLQSLFSVAPDGAMNWAFTTGGLVQSSPAVAEDGTVYVGSDDTNLYAVNADGSLRWAYKTNSPVGSSPVIGPDGTVYVGSMDCCVYAITPDGVLRWRYIAGSGVFSSPALDAGGTVYAGCNDGRVYAINSDGSPKWSFATGGAVAASPAIGADGTVYVGSEDNVFYALNPDGSLRWTFATGGSVDSSPAVGADGAVYFGSDDFRLYALNADGSLRWSYLAGGYVYSSPAIGGDGTVYVGSSDHTFYAIDRDGNLKWSCLAAESFLASPAIGADGTVYAGCRSGALYAFSPRGAGRGDWYCFGHDPQNTHRSPYIGAQTATLKWKYEAALPFSGSPVLGADDTVYIINDIQGLYAFTPTGNVKWVYDNATTNSTPGVCVDGTIVVIGKNNSLADGLNPDGSVKWQYQGHSGGNYPIPCGNGNICIYGRHDNYAASIFMLLNSGALNWYYPTENYWVVAMAVARDSTIYAATTDGLMAVSVNSQLQWTCDVSVTSPSVADDGTIYASHNDATPELVGISPDGAVTWTCPLGLSANASMAIAADGTVYVPCGRTNPPPFNNENKLYAIEPGVGVQWEFDLGGVLGPIGLHSSPAVGRDGTIYIGSEDGTFYALTPDGSVLWTYTAGGRIQSSPAIGSDGTVYVGCDDGTVYAFGS